MRHRPDIQRSLVPALSFFVALAAFLSLGPVRAQAPSQGALPPPAVVVEEVREEPVAASAEFIGRAEAIEAVDVQAQVQGLLEAVTFEGGQAVERGELLFRIAPEQFEADLSSAQAQRTGAEARAVETQRNLERNQELRERGTVSQATLDEAVAANAIAEAEIAAARAAVQQAEINLGYTEIEAAIDGRIGRPLVTRGNLIGPGTGPLARIVQLDPIWVVFSLSEADIVAWRQAERDMNRDRENAGGYRFTLRLPNGSEYDQPGQIDFLESEIDPSTGTMAARVVFPNPEGLLAPGQYLTLEIREENPESLVVVPQSAVQQDREGRFVYVLEEDETVSQRRIQTGSRVSGGWAVNAGLDPGEVVVVLGSQRLSPGLQVRPTFRQASGDGA